MRKVALWTLNVGNGYCPEICEITYPLMRSYAKKIGAYFHVITAREFPSWPVVYEKLQLHHLGLRYDWNIYVDSDALIHPEMFDVTAYLSKDTVLQNKIDIAGKRFRHDVYALRDARHIGSCFPAGVIISGSGPIETISGGIVKGRNGQDQKITALFSRPYTGEIVTLKVACLPEIEVTANHEVLVCSVRKKYCRAKQVGSRPKAWNERVPSEPRWIDAGKLTSDDWVLVPCSIENRIGDLSFVTQGGGRRRGKRRTITIKVDADVAWVLGLYVAEGHIAEEQRLKFTLNRNEEEIAKRVLAVFKKLGVVGRITNSPSQIAGNTIAVDVSCSSLAKLFAEMCGRGAASKKVPRVIMESPVDVIRGFINGLVEGDGCVAANGKDPCYRLVTISRQLVFDLMNLFFKIGISASSGNPRKQPPEIQGRKVNSQLVYEVNWSLRAWNGNRSKKGRRPFGHVQFIGNYAYLPIRKISKREVCELPVFNLETEDHTYGVPFVVHNCNWFTVASNWCLDLWKPMDDMIFEQAIGNISLTLAERQSELFDSGHLIDDYVLSRNIARYGLKFKTLVAIQQEMGDRMQYLWHDYLLTTEQKIEQMKTLVKGW